MHIAHALLLGFLSVATRPSLVHASDPKPDRQGSAFWSEASAPEAQRAQVLLRQAKQELVAAQMVFPLGWTAACQRLSMLAAPLDLPGFAHKRTRIMASMLNESMQRIAHLDNAIVRLELATALAPADAEILYTLGAALREWERPAQLGTCESDRRDAEAIAVLERLRAQHPEFRPASVSFALALLYTSALQFDRAARCYAEGAPLELDTDQLGVLYSNWAEVTMLSGDLVAAVRLYQRAIRVASRGREYMLPLWGSAVALDRLGEHESALEFATRALNADGGTMAVLHSEGVFYEPESEIHYYEGLGHEARMALPRADQDAALEQAIVSWQTFLATGGDTTPWVASARDNLRRLEAEREHRRAAALKRAPKPKQTRASTARP